MIEAIRSYSSQSLLGVVTEGIPALLNSLSAVVNRIALELLLQVAISIPLFYLHHNLFALGFIIGFIFDEQVTELIEKVNTVYSARRSSLENVLFFGGGSFLVILTMPTSLVMASLYYSAIWGAALYQNSARRQELAHE